MKDLAEAVGNAVAIALGADRWQEAGRIADQALATFDDRPEPRPSRWTPKIPRTSRDRRQRSRRETFPQVGRGVSKGRADIDAQDSRVRAR
jgi:hypothetical protein